MGNTTSSWNSTLEIGQPLIDMQHKQLLDQMNALVAALNANSDLKHIKHLLQFLDMYIENHFGYEEQCMHLQQCPVAGQNKAAHEQFKIRLEGIRSMIEQQRPSGIIAQKISTDLLNWFVNHIRTIDINLRLR